MALGRNFLIQFSKLWDKNDITRVQIAGTLKNVYLTKPVRTAKHYAPKFKWLRQKKVKPVILPKTDLAEELRLNSFKENKLFPRYWKSRELTITTSFDIFDPYKPPEGDGKVSDVSSGVISKVTDKSKSKFREISALRRVKRYEKNFSPATFVQEAQDIYVKAHTVLMTNDAEELSKYVTEKANAEMTEGLKNRTLKWKFIESLDPPKLVQTRVQEVVASKNLFAQLTVRFHTKQCLTIYDRFGRLMCGSEILAKDVLEYVIFEKHINNEYGVWRLHAKIIPEWREKSTSFARTYEIKNVEEEDDDIFPEDEIPGFMEHKETAEIVKAESKA